MISSYQVNMIDKKKIWKAQINNSALNMTLQERVNKGGTMNNDIKRTEIR